MSENTRPQKNNMLHQDTSWMTFLMIGITVRTIMNRNAVNTTCAIITIATGPIVII